jgi:hypothetical protein
MNLTKALQKILNKRQKTMIYKAIRHILIKAGEFEHLTTQYKPNDDEFARFIEDKGPEFKQDHKNHQMFDSMDD